MVYAIDSAGNRSANSNQVTVTTPAASPPGVPMNLRVTGATPNTLSFAWDAAPNAVRYQLHSPVGGTHNVTGTSYTVHWLQTDSPRIGTSRPPQMGQTGSRRSSLLGSCRRSSWAFINGRGDRA